MSTCEREPRAAPLNPTRLGDEPWPDAGRGRDPLRRKAHTVQRAEHPQLGTVKVARVGAHLAHGDAVRVRRRDDKVFGDARDARHSLLDAVQHALPPPHKRAVRAFDDLGGRAEDDRLARAGGLHAGAQTLQRVEVGALDAGLQARVVRRGGDDDLGARCGCRAHPQRELCTVAACAQFDTGEPVARGRDEFDSGRPERLRLRRLAKQRGGAGQKPVAVVVEPRHRTVDDAPRVGDEHRPRLRVAPVDRLPRPAGRGRATPDVQAFTHKIQLMRAGLLVESAAPQLALTGDLSEAAEALLLALDAAHPGADGLVWLDSGMGARTGVSLLAVGERVRLDDTQPVLPALRAALADLPALAAAAEVVPLGLVGWFGYELRGETMGMPTPPVPGHHRAAWLRVDRGVLLDHETGTLRLIALDAHGSGDWIGDLADWRHRMLGLIAGVSTASPPPLDEPPPASAAWRVDDAEYAQQVRQCQEAIREGEAYQLCLTTQATVTGRHDPIAVYRRLRRGSPAHHGALLRIGGSTLLSASPETFLRVTDRVVSTRPIKGTRARHHDPVRDAALAAELSASDKEQAENLMIVDLMRNDLSRVSEVGTVAVTGLLEVESYAHVHQLVSTVQGRLRDGLDALDAVAACLPAGSMTGAPKRRAIELLAELESAPRGVYSGTFGYLGVDGSADLAMVIRSILLENKGGEPATVTVGAGGGVTALSDPDAERAEMHLKARALLGVLGVEAQPVP